MVAITSVLVYWFDTAPVNYWTYLETGWKFPVVATLIFAVVSQNYHRTKHRLERRNRELQQAVRVEIAQRELQVQELERAREIQPSLLPKQIPQITGFEITGAGEPARVIRLSESKIAICIADVVGKSVSAALLMIMCKPL